jgi:hypothetical protein
LGDRTNSGVAGNTSDTLNVRKHKICCKAPSGDRAIKLSYKQDIIWAISPQTEVCEHTSKDDRVIKPSRL